MLAKIQHKNKTINVDFSKPIDISITTKSSKDNVNAWYVNEPEIKPVKEGEWTASVKEGASINFNNIAFNPHAHSTHTECVGHITEEFYSVNKALKQFMFLAEVISVAPEKQGEDLVITKKQLAYTLKSSTPEALIIRTMPNTKAKRTQQHSHTNWPFLTEEAAQFIKEKGIQHLLIDLPSVDKEKDEGLLVAHKAFWGFPNQIRYNATITELIYLPNKVKDGSYLLNLQMASFKNDATPSKPVLYELL